MSNATGLYTLVRQLGGSLGIALLELIETRRENSAQQASPRTSSSVRMVSQMLHTAHDPLKSIATLARMVDLNATVVAYDYVFRFCAIVFVVSIPTVLLLAKRSPTRRRE